MGSEMCIRDRLCGSRVFAFLNKSYCEGLVAIATGSQILPKKPGTIIHQELGEVRVLEGCASCSERANMLHEACGRASLCDECFALRSRKMKRSLSCPVCRRKGRFLITFRREEVKEAGGNRDILSYLGEKELLMGQYEMIN